MQSAVVNDHINGIPREFRNAIVYAVKPNKELVGIKLFLHSNHKRFTDGNGNTRMDLGRYIDICVENAIEMKSNVECGQWDLETQQQIILNPPIDLIDAETVNRSVKSQLKNNLLLKQENELIELANVLINCAQKGKFKFEECKICLCELYQLSEKKRLTPLMLKKNPQIVDCIEKLCRYKDRSRKRAQEKVVKNDERIRRHANKTLRGFKSLMGYSGTNEQFMNWFDDSSQLFRELTAQMSDDERCQLTNDPESTLSIE